MGSIGLEAWIDSQTKHAPGATWIELRHLALNDRQGVIQRWALDDDRQTVIQEVWGAAQQWTDSVGAGSQRFCIAMLDSADHVLAQFMARVGSDAVGGTAWDSEPATLEGVTKQLMRHNEAHAKLAAASVQSVIDRLLHENDRLSERVRIHEEKHMELLALYESLLSTKQERDMALHRQHRQELRKDALVSKLATLVPVAAAKLLGKGQLAPDPTVKALAQSLQGEQVQQIASILQPEQLVALADLLERHADPVDDQAGQDLAHADPEGMARA